MPIIQIAGEDTEYIARPIGVDPTGKVKVLPSGLTTSDIPLKVDANGQLYTLPQSFTTTGAKLHVDANGNIYVTPANLGTFETIYDVVTENVQNLSLAAGTNTLTGTAVPDGYYYVITHIAIYYGGTTTNVVIQGIANIVGNNVPINYVKTPVSTQWYPVEGKWVLKAGDYLSCIITNATLNDDGILRYCGYKVKI
jgi:hypothetical protein